MKNIGIIGVGGVGGYFGGKLCQVPGLNVCFVARGEHLRAVQANGLILDTENEGVLQCHPALATDQFEALPLLDLCLLCVKEFDLAKALHQLKHAIGPRTIVIPLLNGMDAYARVRKVEENGVVLPATVYVGTHIEKPGTVRQRGGACKVFFGPDPDHPDYDPEPVLALFNSANIKAEWTLEVKTRIWEKFIFICSYGLVCAAYNKTIGEVLGDASLKGMVIGIMEEVLLIASKVGVTLPASTKDDALKKAENFPPETKTSFQRDFERKDKPDERDLFAGAMLDAAVKYGVEIPTTRKAAQLLESLKGQVNRANDRFMGGSL